MPPLHVMLCMLLSNYSVQSLRIMTQVLREQALILQIIVFTIINSSLFIIN